MDMSFYCGVYGPYRLTPEQVRDRSYYGREPRLKRVWRHFHHACEVLFEEVDYAVRFFCWIVRRDWEGVRRMMVGGERE